MKLTPRSLFWKERRKRKKKEEKKPKTFLRPWLKQFLLSLSWHLSETVFYFALHQCKEALNIGELKRSQNIKVLIRHFHILLVWQPSGWLTSQLPIQKQLLNSFWKGGKNRTFKIRLAKTPRLSTTAESHQCSPIAFTSEHPHRLGATQYWVP